MDAAPLPPDALRWSPAWAVEPLAGTGPTTVVLSAGADRRVAVDGLDPATRQAVERWSLGLRPDPDPDRGLRPDCGLDPDRRCGAVEATTPEERRLADRLVEVGALVPAVRPAVGPTLVGDPGVTGPLGALLADLRPTLPADARPTGPDRADGLGFDGDGDGGGDGGGGGLVVAVRTGAGWPAVPDGAVHLGLDLSLHHTVGLGPLVVPGASACLGCLDARVAHHWPAPTVPPRPAVLDSLAVAAALLRVQVTLAATGTSPLVNATVVWDLERGTTDRQSLYKLAGCPRCATGTASGRVALDHAEAA